MLQLFDNKYPYTDFHELNLDWIISRIIQMDHKLTNFVSLNTIKYADPIGWDITKQYETNTVVMDSSTGIAYISSKPVPAGVSIGNTDYWSVIFDLQEIIGNINQNLTVHDNGASPTLLFSVNEGDWILWNSKLYKALADMIAGTALIEGTNIDAASVEQLTKDYTDALATIVGLLSDLQTTDTSSIVNAINSIISDFGLIIGNLSDLNTSDKTSIVNAINEVLSDIGDLTNLTTSDKTSIVNSINEVLSDIGDLTNLTTSDKTSIVNSINEVSSNLNALSTNVGDLADLDTSDKTSIVNAINEAVASGMFINVQLHGVTGDGITDDTSALQTLINSLNEGVLFFPSGEYLISSITLPAKNISLLGEPDYTSVFKCLSNNISLIVDHDTFSSTRRSYQYLTINGNGKTAVKCFDMYRVGFRKISDIHFINCYDGFYVDCSRHINIKNIYQVGDLHNVFTSSRMANNEYNWNTIVDNWTVNTNPNPSPHGAWFDLTAMICTQWSNMVTMGRMECNGFVLKGMNEGTFFNNVVLVCPNYGFVFLEVDNISPACIDINNLSIDQPFYGGLTGKAHWVMCDNMAICNGNQRNNSDSAVVFSTGSYDLFFNNVLIYNMNYAGFSFGDVTRTVLSNVVATAGSISHTSYTCPSQTTNNPKLINCDLETPTMPAGLVFNTAVTQVQNA